ncbi:glycine betaine ABC transporter substrate-binding protein [Streptomyces sp. gb14]|uniref:glycine betaine ABC transporter substrate-binding protein n=1 Tax=Streptomyces sp. gb14 TaxID=1827753 RepID=UPI000BF10433|nr:glycine betaine ABC transporter substrate-binding protein [Streptomyces sp. gb14]
MGTQIQEVITLGNIALSFHRAAAAVMRRILHDAGHDVRTVEGTHEELFALQAAGEIDILMSAWLPASHGQYIERYRGSVEVLDSQYEPFCVWSVPSYVPEGVIAEVADLKLAGVASRMTQTLDGINPGAGISRFSARMITEYGLDRAGYSFRPGTEESFVRRVERGVAEGEWFVVPLWRPYYLNSHLGLRPIAEPLGLLGGRDAASPVVDRRVLGRISPTARKRLRGLRLGNDGVEAIDTLINVHGLTPQDAADRWLRDTGQAD